MTAMIHAPHAPCYIDLRDKSALVTGGGSGIGHAISLRLAQENMNICLCGRTQETLAETASQIDTYGVQSLPVVADLGVMEDIENLVEQMLQKFGCPDVVVHNAAMMRGGNLDQTSVEYWQRLFATNIESCYHLARLLVPKMRERGSGSIIFITTIGAQQAHHGMLAYDSAKGAMDVFTRSLALECAPFGIRVNAVAPGATASRVKTENVPAKDLHQPYIPLQRKGTGEEIAAACAFLASEQASYITGQILTVDGGATAQLSPRGVFI